VPQSDAIDNVSSRKDLNNRDGRAIRNDPSLLTPEDSNTQQSSIAQHRETRKKISSTVSNEGILSMRILGPTAFSKLVLCTHPHKIDTVAIISIQALLPQMRAYEVRVLQGMRT